MPQEPNATELLSCPNCGESYTSAVTKPRSDDAKIRCKKCGSVGPLGAFRHVGKIASSLVLPKPKKEPRISPNDHPPHPAPARESFPNPLQVQVIKTGGREYQRQCIQCGKVWHSLIARERQVSFDQNCNNCDQVAHCCEPTARLQANRNTQATNSELDRLRKCPNCGSGTYNERIV